MAKAICRKHFYSDNKEISVLKENFEFVLFKLKLITEQRIFHPHIQKF